ncbi:MAG: hypothetical protein V1870_02760 [Candidatus Aenigmatarchaeota archaeon]
MGETVDKLPEFVTYEQRPAVVEYVDYSLPNLSSVSELNYNPKNGFYVDGGAKKWIEGMQSNPWKISSYENNVQVGVTNDGKIRERLSYSGRMTDGENYIGVVGLRELENGNNWSFGRNVITFSNEPGMQRLVVSKSCGGKDYNMVGTRIPIKLKKLSGRLDLVTGPGISEINFDCVYTINGKTFLELTCIKNILDRPTSYVLEIAFGYGPFFIRQEFSPNTTVFGAQLRF